MGDGREIARLTLEGRGEAGTAGVISWITEAGSWDGNRVIEASSAGLAVFRVDRNAIRLAQVIRFNRARYPVGVFEPVSDGRRRVAVWAQLPEKPRQAVAEAAVVECDRVALRCVRGTAVSSVTGPRLVHNPSRP